jgi:hypothetical protein
MAAAPNKDMWIIIEIAQRCIFLKIPTQRIAKFAPPKDEAGVIC